MEQLRSVTEPVGKLGIKSARAAYANLARMNFSSTLIFISDIVGIKGGYRREESIERMDVLNLQNNTRNSERIDKTFQMFCRHFPFVKAMNEEVKKKGASGIGIKTFGYNDAAKILKKIATVLTYYRDQSTHHIFRDERTTHEEYLQTEATVARYLDTCFTMAIRLVKQRYPGEFSGTHSCLDFLNGRTRKDASGKVILNIRHPMALVQMDYGKIRLNELGKIYLISQFVAKQYASELLDKSGIFTDLGNPKHNVLQKTDVQTYIRDIFSALRMRMPDQKLDSTKGLDQLGLDMLGELKRCPMELFDLIPPQNQEEFRYTDGRTGESVLFRRSTDRFPHLALSYIDQKKLFSCIRFAVNVGRYKYVFAKSKHCIDGQDEPRILQKDLNGFGRLQEIEQIRRGLALPETSDGSEAAPLWPYQDLIKGADQVAVKDTECCPYIQDTYARYLFHGDHIGLAFGKAPAALTNSGIFGTRGTEPYATSLRTDGDLMWYLPEITPAAAPLTHASAPCIEPQCWLSVYDIPAMLFYTYLTENDGLQYGLQAAEKVIVDEVVKYQRFFQEISEGKVRLDENRDVEEQIIKEYGLRKKDIPEKLWLLLTKTDYDAEARYRKHLKLLVAGDEEFLDEHIGVKGEYQWSKDRREAFQKDLQTAMRPKENKWGKDGYVEIRPWSLARWVLKDIVNLQKYSPETGEDGKTRSNKLTGLNYTKFQSILATYRTSSEELESLFNQVHILDTHPFLKKVFRSNKGYLKSIPTMVDFYQGYMAARESFFKELKSQLDNGTIPDYGFFRKERQRWQNNYLETLPEQYYDPKTHRYIPVYLPTGLFVEPIRRKLERFGNNALSEAVKDRANVTFMIKKYFEIIMHDDSQPYYQYPRTYPFHTYFDKKRTDIDNLHIPAPSTNFWTAVQEARQQRPVPPARNGRRGATAPTPFSEDTLKKKWKDMMDTEKLLRRLQVQDMLLFMLGKKIAFPADEQEGFFLKNVGGKDKARDILSRPVNVTTTVRIGNKAYQVVQTQVKARDYTEVYAMLRDLRTQDLLPKLNQEEIPAESLREELKHYDQRRPLVFKTVLEYERTRYERFANELREGRVDFTILIERDDSMSESDKNKVREIRNAFSHNRYADTTVKGQSQDRVALYTPSLPSADGKNSSADTLGNELDTLAKSRR